MSALVHTEGLTRRFGRQEAVHDLALSIAEGTVYGLVGPNGAGKTTTIKLLMNIVAPTAGRASVLGADSRGLGPREFQQIGYVSENQELPDSMTVDAFLGYWKPFYPTWDDARAEALVRQFDLPRARKLRHLSRGMRMKAALASSLAYHPKLLVLDEPFSGLDPLVRDEFIEGLIASAEETTMLIASHDLAEIESFATDIGFMDRGRLTLSESIEALAERFREIEVTAPAPLAMPSDWPRGWLTPDAAGCVVRFVDSHFDRERTTAEVVQRFGDRAALAATPMSLRAIFVALARESRRAA
jgi:ABC-2 type transport system ATP-binding protein